MKACLKFKLRCFDPLIEAEFHCSRLKSTGEAALLAMTVNLNAIHCNLSFISMNNLYRALVIALAFYITACTGGSTNLTPSSGDQMMSELQRSENELIDKLLYAADDALREDRLTTPLDDNAMDRYRAVLVLDPSNIDALTGMQTITQRYLDWARSYIDRDNLTRAGLMLARAKTVDPSNADIKAMAEEIIKKTPSVLKSKPYTARDNEWPLDTARLDSHHPRLVSELSVIAQRLKLSGESMLIVARNDKEGRWIYKKMRQAVPGYRLRGNIKMGQKPKIVIQPSL